METLSSAIEISACTQLIKVKDVESMCLLAKAYDFMATLVNPCFLSCTIKNTSERTAIKNHAAINMPLGCDLTSIKVYAAKQVEIMGAQQISVMVNMNAFLSGNLKYTKQDIDAVCDSVKIPVTAVIESSLLNETELCALTELVGKTRAARLQTGAALADDAKFDHTAIKTILDHKTEELAVKAAGVADKVEDLLELRDMGVETFCIPAPNAKMLMEQADKKLGRDALVF